MAAKETFLVRLPKSLYDRLKAIADEERRTIGATVEVAVMGYLEENGKEEERAEGKG